MYLPNAAAGVPDAAQTAAADPQWQVLVGRRPRVVRRVPKSWYAGIGALLLAVLVLYVHTVVTEVSLNNLQRDLKALKEQNVQQRSYLAAMQNPRRIETVATKNLAMQEPKEVVYLAKPVAQVTAPRVNQIPPPPAVVHEGF